MTQPKKLDSKLILICALLVVFLVSVVLLGIGIGKNGGIDPMDARGGVVWVNATVADTQGNSLSGSGTGWMIGTLGQPAQYVVTNGHVVQFAYEAPKADSESFMGEVLVVFSQAENDFMTAQVVYYSPPQEKDLAILKLPVATDKRTALTLRDSDDVAVGETVYALGYPGVSSELQSYTKFDQSDITVTRGIISKRTAVTDTEYESFQMDTYINGGNSGGPLVDEHGFVVGINTLGAVDPDDNTKTDMNFAIITDELTKILDAEGLPYAMKGQESWMVFLFAALAALSLAGAAAAILTRRKKKTASAKPAVVPGSTVAIRSKAIMRGISGQYAGEVFIFNLAPLTLGRDAAQCNIVFEANTPGVSSNHCTIQFNAASQGFELTDNGSSYGTFLENGKKLTPNMPVTLSAGNSFYLADGTQRFLVAME